MKIKRIIVTDENEPSGFRETGQYSFICPGCGDHHVIPTSEPNYKGACWTFNGSVNWPTFKPSILVRSGHFAYDEPTCWCTYNRDKIAEGKEPCSFTCYICHSFVTDGKIQFLGDCTHKLAGQTVELTEINP